MLSHCWLAWNHSLNLNNSYYFSLPLTWLHLLYTHNFQKWIEVMPTSFLENAKGIFCPFLPFFSFLNSNHQCLLTFFSQALDSSAPLKVLCFHFKPFNAKSSAWTNTSRHPDLILLVNATGIRINNRRIRL